VQVFLGVAGGGKQHSARHAAFDGRQEPRWPCPSEFSLT